MLQIVKHLCIIRGDSGFSRQGLKKTNPFWIGFEWCAVEDFQHPLNLTFSDEWYTIIGDKTLHLLLESTYRIRIL